MKRDKATSGSAFRGGRNACRCVLALTVLVAMLTAAAASATTYYVDDARPDDTGDGLSWATAMKAIQTAIDSSTVGDLIMVKYGTYKITTALLLGSYRLITSDDGTNDSWYSAVYADSLCILDASQNCRVMTVTGTFVTEQTRIRGFTFTGGLATNESPGAKYGGGIYIAGGADPWFEECRVTQNTATTVSTGYGGGIACVGSGTEPRISLCRIDHNLASSSWYGYGGGIYCKQSTGCEISHCYVTDNTASSARAGFGGGICSMESTIDVVPTIIENNVAASAYAGEGGGIYVYRGNVVIAGNAIRYNRAGQGGGRSGKGGGIFTSGSGNILINDNHIHDNIASPAGAGYGGGIHCGSGYTEIRDNRIENNVAAGEGGSGAGDGGGIYLVTYGEDVLRGNRIALNTASRNGTGRGGGIYTSTYPEIDRNVVAYNIASESGEGYGGACYFTNSNGQEITNNTLYRNANTIAATGSGAGSGIYHGSGGSLKVDNNIVAGHSVEHSDSLGMHFAGATGARYTCFFDNPGGNYNVNVTSTNEMIADPRFTDPADSTLDFSLMYDSPCIESGDPAYVVPEHGAWVADMGALEYTGKRHWRPVTGTGELLFGGKVKAKVNVTTLGTLSEIDMTVHMNEHHPMAPVSIERWYEIDHLGEGATFDLTLTYLEHELSGRTEANLVMWRWDGMLWDGPKTGTVDDVENTVVVFGQTTLSDWIMTDEWGPTHVDGLVPRKTRLFAGYPNPFNPSTTIAYELAAPGHVDLTIYDIAGRRVRILVDAGRAEGYYEAEWDGRDDRGASVASGVYLCRFKTAGTDQSVKLVHLK